jgi:hypothetical protein
MNDFLPYDPGVLPTQPAPKPGEAISLPLDGLPPYKDQHFSIRNTRHGVNDRFIALRQAAIQAMGGRAAFRGAVALDLHMHAPGFERNMVFLDYVAGIMDSLGGSHGEVFTYLPIVYEDDCQVVLGSSTLTKSDDQFYELLITFLDDDPEAEQRINERIR